MRIIFTLRYLLLLFIAGITNDAAKAQINVATLGVPVTQNFDVMGTTATINTTSTLPTGFKVGTDWTTGVTATTAAGGTTGTGALNGSSQGGIYNFANGPMTTSTERSLGFLNSGGFTSPRSIIFAFTNTTGTTITNLDISFDYEKYRAGTRSFNWTFFHGNTSTANTSAPAGDLAYPPDPANALVNPPTISAKVFALTGLNIPTGTTYYLRWTLAGIGGSTNGQGIGIDNFSLTPNSANAFINAVPDTITGLNYVLGAGPSPAQSFVVTGTGTTNPLTVTPPANFEVATAAGGPYVLTPLSINSGATVWVRLKAGIVTPNPYSGTIVLSGGGASINKLVPVSGTVTDPGCAPNITNTCDEYISNVIVNTINKSSGCGSTSVGYSDFASLFTTVVRGQTYSINVNVGKFSDATSGYSTDDIRIWADWDNDGLFDVTEQLVSITDNGGAGAYNFTVPVTAVIGSVTLRIRVVRDGETLPCGSATFGETEDYTLNVISSCTSAATVSAFYPTSGPAGTIVKIAGSGFTGATAVKFNGIAATSFVITSASEINAEVPVGAGTGKITVTDIGGCTYTTGGNFTSITQSGTCTGGVGSYTDLIITEISDPVSGNDHYIEVYNGTPNTINLDVPNNYTLQVFNDGSPGVTTTANITGTIASGQVRVYYGGLPPGPLATAPAQGVAAGFNINDEVRLLKNGLVLDRVKTPTTTPGYNYKRLPSVLSPNPAYNAAEWTITDEPILANRDLTGIGNYTPAAAFGITTNPVDNNTCAISMTVAAAPAGGLTYQWKYQNGTTGLGWTALSDGAAALPGAIVSGSLSTTLNITGDLTLYNNYQFYVEVSSGACLKASTAAQFTLAATRYFKTNSPVTGNWTSSSSWLMSTAVAGPWVATCTYPTDVNSDYISIESGDVITLNPTSLTVDQFTIQVGGILKIPTTTTLIVGNGGTGADMTVLGTLEDGATSSNSVNFNTGATWSLGTVLIPGTFIKTNNSSSNQWQDNYDGGIATIPSTANWILRYIGVTPNITLTSIGAAGGAYYPNLTFENTAGGTWAPPAGFSRFTGSSGFITVKGNLDIGGSGPGFVVPVVNENTNLTPLLIIGNLIVRAGSSLSNAGTVNGTGFEVKGNITVGGTFTANSGATGVLRLTGTTAQTIFGGALGSGNINLQNVIVNNTSTGVTIARDLTVGGNLTLTQGLVNPLDYTLSLADQIIRTTGNIDGDSATINMTGAVGQTIPVGTFQANNLRNLIISNTETTNGVTLGGKVDLYGMLSFGNGSNKLLTSNGLLTLRSTAAGTAMVADVSNNGLYTNNRIDGNVIVERYFPNRRAWRLLTAPVTNTGTIYQQWQNGGVYKPNSGTYVTKPFGSGLPGDGLEQSLHYSMDTFNVTTQNLDAIKNTHIPLSGVASGTTAANKGYFTFVRGDRTLANLTPPNSNITSLKDTGLLQTYLKVFSSAFINPGNFLLIGNPYASPVDFGKITRSANIPRKFWAWDPRLNATLGAYVLVDGLTSTYIITPAPDPIVGTTGQDSLIQSSQAFFVQATSGTSASVTFNENDKATRDNNTVFRPAASLADTAIYENLRINLYLNDPDTAILADGVYEQFNDSFSEEIDGLDGLKFTNFLENFGILSHGKILILERRPLIKDNDTIFFKLWNTTERNYQFRFISNRINHPGLEGYLKDSYTNDSTPVDLNGYTTISFSITGDAASKAQNRFMLVFKSAAGGPLPLTFTTVKASQQTSNINVEWNVSNEISIKQYEVERSSDGVHFTKVGSVTATGNGRSISYQWPDENVGPGTYYYRIRSISNNGEVKYSAIVKVTLGKGASLIVVSPNPVQGSSIHLQLINQPKGKYGIRLLNNLGQLIMMKQVDHEEGSSTETLPLNKALAHGSYQLEVTKPDNSNVNINVLY